jgi:hypothetical protein
LNFKAILTLVLLLTSSLILAADLLPATHANTTTTITIDATGCPAIGGSWDGPSFTCTLSSTYEINSNTLLLLTFGTLQITSSGIIGNAGTFFNKGGNVNNEGIFENQANGILNNTGSFNNAPLGTGSLYNDNGAIFNNPGDFTNSATMNNAGTTNVLSGGAFFNNGPGTIDNTGTIDNSGAFHNAGTLQNSAGLFLEECGATITDNVATNPFFVNNVCQPASSSSISALTSDLASDFSSLQASISSLSTLLSTDFTSLSTAISNVQTTVNSINTSVTSTIPTALSNIQSALTSLSTAIAKIGVSGPTVGTSNDATVATSPAITSLSSFTTGATNWTQVTPGSANDQVLTGYVVSTDKGAITDGTLYISLTSTPSSPGATYAIPVGTLYSGSTPLSGNLRFPFHIPQGDSVYVQLVSSTGKPASATVQLQFENLPINP